MIKLILFLLVIALIIAGTYIGAERLLMMWSGCSKEEAADAIHRFVSQTEPYHAATDVQLNYQLWEVLRGILGERFKDLERLSLNHYIYFTGIISELPYIALTMINYADENEKTRIESALKSTLSKFLLVHGYSGQVLTEWKINTELQLPMLVLQYAETPKQQAILKAWLDMDSKKILQRYRPVLDDDEELL